MVSKISIGVLMMLFIVGCSKSKTSDQNTSEKTFADGIHLTDLNGNRINLSDYRGKTIILNIWATWCKPCIEEFPSMQSLQNTLDPKRFEFLFASSEDENRIEKFKSKNSFDLNFVKLTTSPESLGIYSLPITFIIGSKGELLLTQNGSKDWSSKESIETLKKISI